MSVEALKLHARLNDSDADVDLIPLRIQAATEWAENYTGRAFLQQTWSYTMDRLVDGTVPVLLPRVPVLSIVSVKTYDSVNVETTVDPAVYRLDADGVPGKLFLAANSPGYWATDPRFYGGMVVEYLAGYGTDAEAVPASIRHAVLLLAASFCERLEADTDLKLSEVPFGIRALLDPYKVWM